MQLKNHPVQKNQNKDIGPEIFSKEGGRVNIMYYTDPLCCWSWAFEPQWRLLRFEFGEQLSWRYCMGGLLPDWKTFLDPMNSISRPVQMGPLWMEASMVSGMQMNDSIWMDDPPASSFASCIAVKCAGLQSPLAEELYLRRLREKVMLDGCNIEKPIVLLQIAAELGDDHPSFNYLQFKEDLLNGKGQEAFRMDMHQVRFHQISRFPTLTITRPGNKGVMIVGYRPYPVLLEAIRQVDPSLAPCRTAGDADSYARYWGRLTEREKEEALAGTLK